MPRFKTFNFFQDIGLKSNYSCQKNTNFRALGALLPNLQSLADKGFAPNPETVPNVAFISSCAPEFNHVFALLISMRRYETF